MYYCIYLDGKHQLTHTYIKIISIWIKKINISQSLMHCVSWVYMHSAYSVCTHTHSVTYM